MPPCDPPSDAEPKPALPHPVVDSAGLDKLEAALNDLSKAAAAQSLTYLLLWIYLIFTVTAVTDYDLLVEKPIKLPIFELEVGLLKFFIGAPALFWLVQLYMVRKVAVIADAIRHYLSVAEREAAKHTVNPGAVLEALRHRVDGFVITRLLARFETVRCGAGTGPATPPLPQALTVLAAAVTLVLAPVLLYGAFQIRFLAYQSEGITWWHRICLFAGLALSAAAAREAGLNWAGTARALRDLGTGLFGGLLRRHRVGRRKEEKRWLDRLSHHLGSKAIPAVVAGSLVIATTPGEFLSDKIIVNGYPLGDLLAEAWLPRSLTPHLPSSYIAAARSSVGNAADDVLPGPSPLDISRRDFAGRSLRRALLSRANLSGTILRRADLRGAKLDNAKLQGANLSGTQLQGANLPYAQLQGARLESAQLQGANLSGTQFQEAGLSNANLQGALVTGANFQGTELSNAQLQGARMAGVQFQKANLHYAQFQNANLSGAEFQEANWLLTQLQGADLSEADLKGAFMGKAQLKDSRLIGAHLQGANLSGAQLQGAALSEAQLQEANLSGAQLQGAILSGTQLQGANLSNASLHGAYLAGTQFQGADLSNAQLQGADLSNAQLQDADLSNAQLQGALLSNVRLWGAKYKNTVFSHVYFSQESQISPNETPTDSASENLSRTQTTPIVHNKILDEQQRRENSERFKQAIDDSIDIHDVIYYNYRKSSSIQRTTYLLEMACNAQHGEYILTSLYSRADKSFRRYKEEKDLLLSKLIATSSSRGNCPAAARLTESQRSTILVSTIR